MIYLHRLQECMSMYLEVKSVIDEYIFHLCNAIALIHETNRLCEEKISPEEFYNRTLTRSKLFNFREDYLRWTKFHEYVDVNVFSFCQYPYLLDPAAKLEIIHAEQELTRHQHSQQIFLGINPFMHAMRGFQFFIPIGNPFL